MQIIAASDCLSFVNVLSQRVFEASQARGGKIPFVAIREIIENLLHAKFHGVVVTVCPDGNEVLVADQGPGIPDKDAAMRPGFSTASPIMRRFIKGVGSGLVIAGESLRCAGGSLRLEDNIGAGTVVTLRGAATREKTIPSGRRGGGETALPADLEVAATVDPAVSHVSPGLAGDASPKGEYKKGRSTPDYALASGRRGEPKAPRQEGERVKLTLRQQRVLALLVDFPELGPSTAAEQGQISLSSAYRDLVALEHLGLAEPVEGGKRRLSDKGREYLASMRSAQ